MTNIANTFGIKIYISPGNLTTESSWDHPPAPSAPAARPQSTAVGPEGSRQPWGAICTSGSAIPALRSPPKHCGHPNRLQKITLRCKASAKRKVSARLKLELFFSSQHFFFFFSRLQKRFFLFFLGRFRWKRWRWTTSSTASSASTTRTPPLLSRKGRRRHLEAVVWKA